MYTYIHTYIHFTQELEEEVLLQRKAARAEQQRVARELTQQLQRNEHARPPVVINTDEHRNGPAQVRYSMHVYMYVH